MLDENLPAFFLRPSTTGQKHHKSFYLSYHGSDPEPAYLLQHADPASPSPSHRNCYAAALFDAFNPEVLFGEVLARPRWNQPTLSQEELRRDNGIPPPPQPVLPQDFTVQLYNPDQQVTVSVKEGKWGASSTYEFSMPETTFRTPSASTLDRGQSDPASLHVTPKINFSWRKESKLGKDLVCLMTGKSTDALEKKKSRRDPDIAIALWRSMRELTVYEPNLSRIDLEDPKGLEVVLLLSAVVVKDLYFSPQSRLAETFNIDNTTATSHRKLSGRTSASPPVIPPTPNELKRSSLPKLQTPANPAPPPADPRAQWQLEAETARLRAEQDAENRRVELAREQAAETERLRLLKIVENEEKESRRKQAEVEQETERLRRQYGVQPVPSLRHARPSRQRQEGPYSQPGPARTEVGLAPPLQQPGRRMGSNGLYINSAASSSAVVMSGANGGGGSQGLRPKPAAKKKNFWGLRGASDEGQGEGRKLAKKSSAMW